MINEMNEHLKAIGSQFGTSDGTTFQKVIPSSEKIVILTKRFGSIDEAHDYIMSLKANA